MPKERWVDAVNRDIDILGVKDWRKETEIRIQWKRVNGQAMGGTIINIIIIENKFLFSLKYEISQEEHKLCENIYKNDEKHNLIIIVCYCQIN